MSKSVNKAIENASDIIARFGGIRPMSTKTGVPVTTIQGWKKRGVVPAARIEVLTKAANEHDIDISDLLDGDKKAEKLVGDEISGYNIVVTPEGKQKNDGGSEATSNNISNFDSDKIKKNIAISSEKNEAKISTDNDEFAPKPHNPSNQNYTQIAIETEKRAITKSAAIAVALIAVVIISLGAMLWPDYEEFDEHGNRIAVLEGDMSDIRNQQSMFKGLVPEDWSEQLDELKRQASQARIAAESAVQSVQQASQELMGENAGTLEQRVEKLQTYVAEITGESSIYGLLSRYEAMQNNVIGQQNLDNAVSELASLFASSDEASSSDENRVNGVLDQARMGSDALSNTFADVPQEELKAAAMLLAFTQLRSSLNRDLVPFDEDLSLMMNLVGKDNKALRDSLEKLTPHAKEGVLTPQGLSDEFRSLAGDAVASSLKGEDVSLQEKAMARMNDILKVEKDGEMVSGTKTQATVDTAQKHLEQGNVDAAVKLLKKNLRAKELKPLKPFFREAEALLNASKVKKALKAMFENDFGDGLLGGAGPLDSKNQ